MLQAWTIDEPEQESRMSDEGERPPVEVVILPPGWNPPDPAEEATGLGEGCDVL